MKEQGKKLLALLLSVALSLGGVTIPAAAMAIDGAVIGTETKGTQNNLFGDEIKKEQDRQQSDYYVADVKVNASGRSAEVTVQVVDEADLIVVVYTEDEKEMITSATKKITYEDVNVSLAFSEDLPEYFIVKAFLADTQTHKPLASAYTSQMYTQEMQALLKKDIYDFDSERVVNLDDDSSTNFAVYNEGVVAVHEDDDRNNIEKNQAGEYIISNPDDSVKELKSGDILSCETKSGNLTIVNIASVSVEEEQVILTEKTDESFGIEDVFDTVKIENDGEQEKISVDDSEIGEGITYEGIEKANTKKSTNETKKIDDSTSVGQKLNYSVTDDDVTGTLSFGVTANLRIYLTHSYKYIEVNTKYSLGLQISVTGTISKDFSLGKIKIFTSIPGVVIDLDVSVPLELSSGLTFKNEIYGVIGGAYDSDMGMVNKCVLPKMLNSIDKKISASAGIKGSISVAIIDAELASASLSVSTLLNISGEQNEYTSATASVHDCNECLTGDISAEFVCSFAVELVKVYKYEEVLLDVNQKITDWYYSISFGEFGWKKCPHVRYKTTITVKDGKKNVVPNAIIEGTGLSENPVTDAEGIAQFYLPTGSYALTVKSGDMQGRTDFYIKDTVKEMTITLKEHEDITEKLELFGDAVRQDDGSVHLTELKTWQSGSTWYALPIDTTNGFTANFSYYAGGGREDSYGGADGIVLNLASKTGLGAQGEDLGFTGDYGVEFDSYPYNTNDPSKKHIALIYQDVSNHMVYTEDDRVDDSEWHNVSVEYANGKITVYLDGGKVLARTGVELNDEVYVGLSAATGSGYNVHYIRDFSISVNNRDISVLSENSKSVQDKIKLDREGYTGTLEENDGVKTAEFAGLTAGTGYFIVEAQNQASADLFASDNLLYMDYKTADENGKLSFMYKSKEGKYSDVYLYGDFAVTDDDTSDGTDDGKGDVIGGTSKLKKPAKVKSVKVSGKKKKITVSWKKVSATGYEVQYSLNKKCKKAKTVVVKKVGKTTIKKGLKKKKTYYVRVRAYNKKGTAEKNGAWSKICKVKVK